MNCEACEYDNKKIVEATNTLRKKIPKRLPCNFLCDVVCVDHTTTEIKNISLCKWHYHNIQAFNKIIRDTTANLPKF